MCTSDAPGPRASSTLITSHLFVSRKNVGTGSHCERHIGDNQRRCFFAESFWAMTDLANVLALRDHLEHVAVYRLAEEEAYVLAGTQGLRQVRARGQQALFQRRDFLSRVEDCDVPSKFALKGRDLEAFNMDDVHLLAAACREPDRFHGRVGRSRIASVAERLLEKAGC